MTKAAFVERYYWILTIMYVFGGLVSYQGLNFGNCGELRNIQWNLPFIAALEFRIHINVLANINEVKPFIHLCSEFPTIFFEFINKCCKGRIPFKALSQRLKVLLEL